MTDRKNWFLDLQTKSDMNSFAIGVIEEIMGDISTTPWQKVIAIAKMLQAMNQAWDIKKTPAKGAGEENDRDNCNISNEEKQVKE